MVHLVTCIPSYQSFSFTSVGYCSALGVIHPLVSVHPLASVCIFSPG